MNTAQTRYLWFVVAVILVVMSAVRLSPPNVVPDGERIAFIVYETYDGKPLQGQLAVEALRSQGIQARLIDVDAETVDGTIPEQLRPAIEPAKRVGLPALIVTVAGQVFVEKTLGEMTASQIVEEATRD